MRVDLDGTCDRERQLQEVLASYFVGIEDGKSPDPTALIAGHPELASELREFFALQANLHHLAAPIRDLAIAPTDGERESVPPHQGGRRIGDYDLLGEIARGGVGIVYRARQRSLNRPVAVKVLRDGPYAMPSDARRFRNEAETVANLDHPNIVPIYEVGEEEGSSYFSMKLTDGGSLAERAEEYTADPRRAARLMVSVARAIQHAHSRGILHRDLKPSNILIDDRGEPLVADFGLARRLDVDSDLTRTGLIVGTPSYMAPEQAGGSKEAVTIATDVHGLGAILFYLLTGRPPYGGATVLDILDQVRSDPPRSPSTIRRVVNRDLETICLKCLENGPGRRYPSAEAVAEDLERWLAGRPIVARRVGRAERAWRLCLRHPRSAVLATTGILLAVAAAAGLLASDRARMEAARLNQEARRGGRILQQERYAQDLLLSSHAWTGSRPEEVLRLLDRHRPGPGEEDRREFAWHYFHGLFTLGRPPLSGHTGGVYYAAFSPDGKTLATAGKDRTVRLWDVATRSTRAVLGEHQDEVNWVSYSPDGRALATAGDDRIVRIWDAETARVTSCLAGHDEEVVGAIFTPDGRRIISCDRKGRVIFWNLSGSEIDRSFSIEVGTVQSLAISPDGLLLAISGDDCVIWDVVKGLVRTRLKGVDDLMNAVAFSHDGVSLAIASRRDVKVWAARDLNKPPVSVYTEGYGPSESVAFSPDDRLLAWFSSGGIIHLTDLARGVNQRIPSLQPGGRLWCAAFSPDGRSLATTGGDGTVKLWDLERDRSFGFFRVPTTEAITGALSPDGARFIAADRSGNLWIHDTLSGRLVAQRRLPTQTEIVYSVLTTDARRLVTVDKSGTIDLWDVESQRRHQVSPAPVPFFYGLAISPGGELIAKCIPGHGVFVWDEVGNAPRRLAREWGGDWVGMALSRDGLCAFLAEGIGGPVLWDAVSGRTWASISPGHRGPTVAWSFSPDGAILATGGSDGCVILWDTKSLDPLYRFEGAHDAAASAVAFSPDGRTMVTGGADGRVRLWDPDSRRELATLTAYSRPVGRACFSADSHTLATSCYGVDGRNEVTIWHAAPREPAPDGP